MKKPKINDLGWRSGFRLALYHTLFFTLVSGAVYVIADNIISTTIRRDEYELVNSYAEEYRAWFISGQFGKLEARMNEQLLKDGDSLFVHISGPGREYTNFNSRSNVLSVEAALHELDATKHGIDIPLGGRRWTVASVPIGKDGLVLQAGKHSASLETTLTGFRRMFLLTMIPACLVSVLGGTFITYRHLSPVRQLIKTMNRILAHGELGQRAYRGRSINELNALVDIFNDLLDRNQSLVLTMRDSLDHIAHDLRTPVSRFRITAERALQTESSPLQLREALADCVEESEYLEQLLTVLLNVSEAKAGVMKLQKETFAVKSLLVDVADLYEFVAEDKNINLRIACPDDLTLHADRTRMAQVVANLLDNAAKYSQAGTTVELTAKQEGGRVILGVQDQGIGISAADIPHVWKRLYRADPSRSTPGMGLGLSLVKAVVELHGGAVDVVSKPDRGTTFLLKLPTQ